MFPEEEETCLTAAQQHQGQVSTTGHSLGRAPRRQQRPAPLEGWGHRDKQTDKWAEGEGCPAGKQSRLRRERRG